MRLKAVHLLQSKIHSSWIQQIENAGGLLFSCKVWDGVSVYKEQVTLHNYFRRRDCQGKRLLRQYPMAILTNGKINEFDFTKRRCRGHNSRYRWLSKKISCFICRLEFGVISNRFVKVAKPTVQIFFRIW